MKCNLCGKEFKDNISNYDLLQHFIEEHKKEVCKIGKDIFSKEKKKAKNIIKGKENIIVKKYILNLELKLLKNMVLNNFFNMEKNGEIDLTSKGLNNKSRKKTIVIEKTERDKLEDKIDKNSVENQESATDFMKMINL